MLSPVGGGSEKHYSYVSVAEIRTAFRPSNFYVDQSNIYYDFSITIAHLESRLIKIHPFNEAKLMNPNLRKSKETICILKEPAFDSFYSGINFCSRRRRPYDTEEESTNELLGHLANNDR